MPACPFCDEELKTRTGDSWACRCGELILFSMEEDEEENCARCPIHELP